MLPVLVINRDRDRERWDRTLAACRAQGAQPERVPAVDAHDPEFTLGADADLIVDHFWGRDTIKPGAVGCFLSHRKAWQRVIDRGWPAALILEDDADLVRPPAELTDFLDGGFDLIFVNDRLADWAVAVDDTGATPLPGVAARVAEAGGPKQLGVRRAPGADAYIVTAVGAAQLLAQTRTLGIVCGVDWAMVWLSLGGGIPRRGIEELETLASLLSPTARPIRAGILSEPAAKLRGGPSVLKHSVEVPIRALVQKA